jgi:aspartate aminotransferase
MIQSRVKASQTLAMLQKVNEMKAAGVDVVSFAAGEPDFPTPEVVCDAAIAALKKGITKYVPTAGWPALRKAVAEDYKNRLGVSWCRPENVIITAGGKQGIYLTFAALLEKGDEVLVPKPYWVSYPDVVEAALGKVVMIDTSESRGFFASIDELERARTPKTKALVFSSPGNPTGTMIDEQLLKDTIEWCHKNKVTLLYDELYERLVLGSKKHVSALALAKNEDAAEYLVSINAFSKTMSMTGWRLGFAVTHSKNIEGLSPLQGQMLTCVPGFLQEGAAQGLSKTELFVPTFVEAYKKRLKILVDGLSKISELRFLKPEGAFYLLVDFSKIIAKRRFKTDKDVVDALLAEERVVTVGGSGMGAPGWVRLSFATNDEECRKGVERITRFCARES